jgi:MoxR-like ATPase
MTHDTSQEVAQQMAAKQREDEERARAEMQAQGQPSEEEPSTYQDSTVAELKDELAERDLPRSGKKEDLVARLEEDDQQGSAQPQEGQS